MATSRIKSRCVICGKEKASVRCEGCSQTFCYRHINDHRQQLNKQLDEIEVTRDLFRQTLSQQTLDLKKHPLIQQINKWEQDSIRIIKQTAEDSRQLIFQHTNEHTRAVILFRNVEHRGISSATGTSSTQFRELGHHSI